MIRSAPLIPNHDGMLCHAAGPDGVVKIETAIGCWWSLISAAAFGLRSWAKSWRNQTGSM